jgi:phosphoribosyl 1,2-cyclic phosphodiesterase
MPQMRFIILATGSKGNCAYLATPHASVLIDCGVGPRKLSKLLREHNIDAHGIDAVFVTHNHSDHTGHLGPLLRHIHPRVYCHAEAEAQLRQETLANSGMAIPDLCPFANGDGFHHRDLDVLPVRVSHDATPTVMYKLYAGRLRVGVLTDLGAYSAEVLRAFSDCDILLLEANHDLQMLARGPYPESLKRRIKGDRGHLSNRQSAEFVVSLPQLPRHLFLGHLSDTNNRPDLASAEFTRIETGAIPHCVLPQSAVGPLVEL